MNPETSVAGPLAGEPAPTMAGQPGVLSQARKPHLVLEPRAGWAALDLWEVWQYRGLLLTLAVRDVKLRYKQTALGVIWVVLQPLIAAMIFALLFGRVAKFPSEGLPYVVFAYATLLGWNAFNGTLTKSSSCIIDNAHMVAKVYFPRLILPLSTVLSTLVDFSIGLILMLVMLIVNHINPGWGILLLPLWVLILVSLSVGIGLYAAALMVPYRDLRYVIPVMLQFLLYASPVGYSLAAFPNSRLRLVLYCNPLTGLLEAVRWSLLGRGQLNWLLIGYSVLAAAFAFTIGAIAFKRMERRFADEI